jgi:hypothetical protein
MLPSNSNLILGLGRILAGFSMTAAIFYSNKSRSGLKSKWGVGRGLKSFPSSPPNARIAMSARQVPVRCLRWPGATAAITKG